MDLSIATLLVRLIKSFVNRYVQIDKMGILFRVTSFFATGVNIQALILLRPGVDGGQTEPDLSHMGNCNKRKFTTNLLALCRRKCRKPQRVVIFSGKGNLLSQALALFFSKFLASYEKQPCLRAFRLHPCLHATGRNTTSAAPYQRYIDGLTTEEQLMNLSFA